MEKLNSLNKDPKFKKLMTEEEDRRKYENTMKKNAKEEGYTQGIMENKIEIAKKMIESKESEDKIKSYTNLSIEEIEQIKNEIKKNRT